ncbi:MAG: magnesium and cobalt transport protein CorA [Deltaproteobacteria bacterium]|nr:MAG: magnesium and cobalt transport protein CorA [Deltaproteobacteria bacterium]
MLKAFSLVKGKIKEVNSDSSRKSFHWIDCSSPSKTDIDSLTKKLGITPEEFKSNLDQRERPRIEAFDKFTLLIFKTPYTDGKATKTISFPIFLGKNFVITAHKKDIQPIKRIIEDSQNNRTNIYSCVEQFTIKILDYIFREYFAFLDDIEQEIDVLEHKAMKKPDQSTVEHIFRTKKTLIYFHNALSANREVIAGIERELVSQFSKTRLKLFRPLYDDIVQLIDMEATYRDILNGTLEIYLSSVSNNMNVVIKKMTAYGSLILVPTLISGIYGMNFRFLPELEWRYGYYFALLMMLFSVIGLYAYFDKKGWL